MSVLWDAIESSFLAWVQGNVPSANSQIIFFYGTSFGGGVCSAPGAKVGATVQRLLLINPGSSIGYEDLAYRFETTISNDDEIVQLTSTPDMTSFPLILTLG